MNKGMLLALASTATLAATAASAQVTQYTTQAAFTAASGATTLRDFNNFQAGTVVSPATTIPGVSVTTTGDAFIGSGTGGFNVNGSNYLDINLDPGETFTFTFSTAIRSFAADFFSLNNGIPLRTSVTVGGQTFSPIASDFLGYTSATPFTSVIFSVAATAGTNDEFGLDNLRVGTALAPVPEPAAWAMMIAGFAVAGFAMRRRTARVAVSFG